MILIVMTYIILLSYSDACSDASRVMVASCIRLSTGFTEQSRILTFVTWLCTLRGTDLPYTRSWKRLSITLKQFVIMSSIIIY